MLASPLESDGVKHMFRELLAEEVIGAFEGYAGMQKYIRLYFSLPRFHRYALDYRAVIDSLHQLADKLGVRAADHSELDHYVREISRRWKSDRLSDQQRLALSENFSQLADNLLKIAVSQEATSVT